MASPLWPAPRQILDVQAHPHVGTAALGCPAEQSSTGFRSQSNHSASRRIQPKSQPALGHATTQIGNQARFCACQAKNNSPPLTPS